MRTRCSEAAALLLALVTLVIVTGCGTLTVPQEQALGEEFAYKMRAELRMLGDEIVEEYVADIGEKIVRAAGPQPFAYRFYVVEDENINASAGPAGHIFVHTGTILAVENVSELAGVMAHEIGHVALRHVSENMNRHRNAGILTNLGVLGASAFGYGNLASLGGQLAAMAALNTFSRGAEEEADAFAVEVLPAAGIAPNGLVTFFETLQGEQGYGSPPGFLSSHPQTEDRIAETHALIVNLPPKPGLRVRDGGKLEIIQRRIRLLTGREGVDGKEEPRYPRRPDLEPELEPTLEPL